MKKAKIPPVGVKPRFLLDEDRIDDLQNCFYRHFKANWPLPPDLVEEYNELVGRLQVEE